MHEYGELEFEFSHGHISEFQLDTWTYLLPYDTNVVTYLPFDTNYQDIFENRTLTAVGSPSINTSITKIGGGSLYTNGTLENGTADNLRWQIVSPNINNGTFSLIIRQGNDSTNSPSILETWSNLSLDPFTPNYIERVIGNQYESIQSDNGEYYVKLNGEYRNQSRYVRVKQVNAPTPDYFDNTGNPKSQYTGSIPTSSLGVFGGATGKNIPTSISGAYYENISNNNIQGLSASAYTESISLLANKDAYKYNLITAPGLIADGTNYQSHASVISFSDSVFIHSVVVEL
jgi:hypothetical protein